MALTVAELPFRERPVMELLGFADDRVELDRDYAGYGWAKVPRVWLVDARGERAVDDALVLALHSPDDSEPLAGDIELELELPGRAPVSVMLSLFLETWLPKLPAASAIVLVLCNPHDATPRRPATHVPVHYALGDVEAWVDEQKAPARILLDAPMWCTLSPA